MSIGRELMITTPTTAPVRVRDRRRRGPRSPLERRHPAKVPEREWSARLSTPGSSGDLEEFLEQILPFRGYLSEPLAEVLHLRLERRDV
jgi:hypothetical protein